MTRWEEVDAGFRRLARRKGIDDAEEARLLVDGQRTGVHFHLGFGSYAEYLERVLGYTPREASERLRVADALAHLPRMMQALADGELVWSAVRELTRIVRPRDESEWLERARGKSMREIEKMVAGHKPGDRPDDPIDPTLIRKVLRFEVSAETFALIREARQRIQADTGERLGDDRILAEMARAVLDGG